MKMQLPPSLKNRKQKIKACTLQDTSVYQILFESIKPSLTK
jgi:hypothetical protein